MFQVLQTELTPLKHNQTRTHELSSYLMFASKEDLMRAAAGAGGGFLDSGDHSSGLATTSQLSSVSFLKSRIIVSSGFWQTKKQQGLR